MVVKCKRMPFLPAANFKEQRAKKFIITITIRLSIFLTLARACDKRFSADHDTMLSLLIKAFGPWAFTFYQTVFYRIFRREVAKTFSHSYFSDN